MNKQSRKNRRNGLQTRVSKNVSQEFSTPKTSVNAIRAAIATASVIGAGFAGTAAADTWQVSSGSQYKNGNATGTYNNNFFIPGWTGSAGFFESQIEKEQAGDKKAKGAQQAFNIVTGRDEKIKNEYTNAKVNIGGANDTTNLQNMIGALDTVRRTNELRRQEGRSDLTVAHHLVGAAQWQGDYATVQHGHHMRYGAAENLAWGYQSGAGASDGWYSEKKLCPQGPDKCTWTTANGHYLNMVNSAYTITGTSTTGAYGTFQGSYGWGDGDARYTADEYEKLIKEFIAAGGQTYYNENQTVEISSNLGTDSRVTGGYGVAGKEVKNNTVNVNKNANIGTVYGAYTVNNNTSGNTVNINGGTVNTVYGGYSENGSAVHSGNTINIISGKADNVYLGNGASNSGTVNFLGGSVVELKAVKGSGKATDAKLNIGAKSKEDANRTAMNTLKASGEVGGFTEYNFYLPSSVKAGDTALSADKATLGSAAVNVYVPGDAKLKSSESMHLIATNNGVSWNGKASVHQGVTLKTDFGGVSVNGKNLDLSLNGAGSTSTPAASTTTPANSGSSTTPANNQQASTGNGSNNGNGSSNGSSTTTTPATSTGSGNNQQASTGSSTGTTTGSSTGSSGGEVCTGLACIFKPNKPQTANTGSSNGSSSTTTTPANGSSSTTTPANGSTSGSGNNQQASTGTTTGNGSSNGSSSTGSSAGSTTGNSQKPQVVGDTSTFNITSASSFANAGSNVNQNYSGIFDAAENTENAKINIGKNSDYQGVTIKGSKKGNSTITITDAQNLGDVDTHAADNGNQKLTMTNSSAQNVYVEGRKKGQATIKNSKIKSFKVVKTDGSAEIALNNTTVANDITANGNNSVVINNGSQVGGNVNVSDTANATISASKVGGSVTAVNAGSLAINNNASTGDVYAGSVAKLNIQNASVGNVNQVADTVNGKNIQITNSTAKAVKFSAAQNSNIAISNSKLDSYTSSAGDKTSNISFTNGSQIAGNVNTKGENLSFNSAKVGGNIVTTGVQNEVQIQNSSVAGDIVSASNQWVTVQRSNIASVSSRNIKLENTNVTGKVQAAQLELNITNGSNKKVGAVEIQSFAAGENSKIYGSGEIQNISVNKANPALATSLNIRSDKAGLNVSNGISGSKNSSLQIDAQNGTLTTSDVGGFKNVEFSNLATDHSALQLTGAANTTNFANVSVNDLSKYDNGKKYQVVSSKNSFTVAGDVFNQNTTDDKYKILSGTKYSVGEFGLHQNASQTELYINRENVEKQIENKHFSIAGDEVKAVIDIDQVADYAGLNVTGNKTSTINYTAGVGLGQINAGGGTLNIGTAANPAKVAEFRVAENISNVGDLNFYLPATIANGDRFLSLTSKEKTDLTNTNITAYLSGDRNINNGDIVQLIVKERGGEIAIGSDKQNKVAKVQQGITLTTTGQKLQLSEQKDALELVFSKQSASTPAAATQTPAATVNKPTATTTAQNQPANTTQTVTAQPANQTATVTAQPANTTQTVTAQPANTTQTVTAQPANTTQTVTAQPANTTQTVTAQPQAQVQTQTFDASIFEVLSSTSVQEGEDQTTEIKKIQGNLFPLSGRNQTVNIAKNVDYEGLNIQGNNTATINFIDGYNLGVIDGAQTLNIGLEDRPTAMNARTAKNVKNIENLNFYLPHDIKNGDTALSLSSSDKTDLSNVGVTAYLSGDSNISDQDKVHLISKPNGGEISVNANTTATVQQGVTLSSIGQEIVLADDKLNLDLVFHQENNPNYNGTVTTTVNEKTKSLVQAKIAAPALINQSSENLAGSLDNLYSSTQMNRNSSGGQVFANVSAADQKLTTGSHIDMKGANVNVGYAQNIQSDAGTTLAGVFAEYSYADYDTYLDDSTHGSGDVKAYGVGVFANHTFNNGFYVQGSVKGGKTKTKYSSNDFVHAGGNGVSYDTDSSYFAGSVGAGQIIELGQNDNLDIYGKYMYTYVGSDDAKLSSGETYHFDSVKSNRLRAGVRYNHNSSENMKFFAGAAYEYEMNGKANAEYQGYRLPTPSVKGGTAIGEVGIAVKSGKTQFETSLQGFGGKRKGAMLKFGVRF